MKRVNPNSDWFVIQNEDGETVGKYGRGPAQIPEDYQVVEIESIDELNEHEVSEWWDEQS